MCSYVRTFVGATDLTSILVIVILFLTPILTLWLHALFYSFCGMLMYVFKLFLSCSFMTCKMRRLLQIVESKNSRQTMRHLPNRTLNWSNRRRYSTSTFGCCSTHVGYGKINKHGCCRNVLLPNFSYTMSLRNTHLVCIWTLTLELQLCIQSLPTLRTSLVWVESPSMTLVK